MNAKPKENPNNKSGIHKYTHMQKGKRGLAGDKEGTRIFRPLGGSGSVVERWLKMVPDEES